VADGSLLTLGESLTGDEIVATFERITGIPSACQRVSLDIVRESVPGRHDLADMFAFFIDYCLAARTRDLSALRAIHPELRSFADWLSVTGWLGDEAEVRRRAFIGAPGPCRRLLAYAPCVLGDVARRSRAPTRLQQSGWQSDQ
jgi:hypothetical protein